MKKQFDIWTYDFPGKGVHPCVIISPPDFAARSRLVNVLFCTSQRQNRAPYAWEIMLDAADGLSWETFVHCGLFVEAPSAALIQKRGHVSHERRNQIRDKIRDLFRVLARD